MKFRSEAERMQHPQAQRIPFSLWNEDSLFDKELSSFDLQLMQDLPLKELITLIQADNQLQINTKRAWLSIALSHPELKSEELECVSDALKISTQDLFRLALAWGKPGFFQFLITEHESALQEMIAANDWRDFWPAAEKGQLDVLNYLAEKAPDKLQAIIVAENYRIFWSAASHGHLGVLNYLAEKAPDKLQAMIANNYRVFWLAASNGHLSVLNYLAEKAPDKLQEMMATGNYIAFRFAASNGHLSVLNYLAEKAPDKLQEMMATGNYWAFKFAASNGHLDVLNYLAAKAPDKLQAMIAAYNYRGLIEARHNGHQHIVNYLLQYATAFAYAEQHMHEFEENTQPFITDKLVTLRAQKTAAELMNPNTVFNVSSEEANLLFYVLRNLIRRNEPGLLDDIRFLLEIPDVKMLVHTEVRPHEPNELLRLALTLSNRGAAEVLFSIPAVRQLAEQNHYYRLERQGGLDLEAIARDTESSIRALSTEEQVRLEQVSARYQPTISAAGVPSIMDALRQLLITRYEAHPAFIERIGSTERLILPMNWQEFKALKLTFEERQAALTAYYQHKDHTAFRYLLKPNPWMHEEAVYVKTNPKAPSERWSDFEEYQPLISLFFLAAQDETVQAINGHTIETRIECFIAELAHIGRAHNWDEMRFKVNVQGEMVLDKQGNPIEEEYDNLQGDRPSCYSGMKRRLFQSVLGHPFFQGLTQELIEQELRDFVRKNFQEHINQEHNAQALLDACDRTYYEQAPTAEDNKLLGKLNITAPKQQQFMTSLQSKYGHALTPFLSYLNDQLSVEKENHATRFAIPVGLINLLEAQIPKDKRVNGLENPIKKPFILALEKYIARIESHSERTSPSRPNFRYGFWVCADSRAANRKANYLLAKELLERLYTQSDDSISDLFQQADSLRDDIITKEKIHKMPGFVKREMNSRELQLILDEACKAPGLKRH